VGAQQFTIIPLAESSTIAGLTIGVPATVHYTVTPQTPFDIDFVHADNAAISTAGFMFSAPADLSVGQQVSVRRNSNSSGTLINADRVRLRSTRVSASVTQIGAPIFFLYNLPSIFSGNSISQLQIQTTPQTILTENNASIVFTEITNNLTASVRGPLFNVAGTRTMVASKVVIKP